MIENIRNSKKLFILIDHSNSEELRKWVENGLKNYQLTDIELNIICPKYRQMLRDWPLSSSLAPLSEASWDSFLPRARW